ncbi:MAG: hypothetical protein MI975_28140 [Cytophagales bacterium]|nr:hypothetical protein [Cytophagales bacterium]
MKPDFFWNSWSKPYKTFYRALLLTFVASVLIYLLAYLGGSAMVIHWETEHVIAPVKTLFETYRLGIFEFPIYVDNYTITQSFVGSGLKVNEWPAYVLLTWLGIFICIVLALISDLGRFWFVASVILLTVLFVGLKLDYLVLFNSYEKIGLIVAVLLYYPSLYVFHFVKKEIGFLPRFATHLLATILFALIVRYFSQVNLPFLHLVNYGIYVPLILTILFAFMIGHEIMSGFLRVVTSGSVTGEKNGLVHFLTISVFFLLNAALVVLRNSKILDLDIYLIGAFGLLTIGSVVGIWGYRAKERTYVGIFNFYPTGAILFICLAITAHLTIAYFFVTGNDSLVEAMEDAIIFSQLGYSLMFIIYVIANFFDLIKNNVNVGKVLYKPRRMPYFISRFAGVIVIMALFFRFNMIPYYQAVAGFYSGIGDLYLANEDYASASEYYKLSNIFSGTSHRANYAMATLEKRAGKSSEELKYLQQAVGKNPTEFAFVNLASKYLEQKRYFEAVFTLQDGLKMFPENGILLNNLGLIYLEMQHVDSAYYHLRQAQFDGETRDEAASNIYALLSKERLSIKPDTLDHLLRNTEYLSGINNLIVLANGQKKAAQDQGIARFGDPEKTKIDQLIYNYNKSLNAPFTVDSLYLQAMKAFYDSGNISWFQDHLVLSNALALYRQGEVSSSLELLNLLAIQNPEKGYYGLLGKLSLQNGASNLAIDYFKSAFQHGNTEIAPELAFAYMEQGALDKAAFIWKQIENTGDSLNARLAGKMISAIEMSDLEHALMADDETRFSFLKYRYREFDLGKLEGLVLSFGNEDVQAMGFLHLLKAYLELDNPGKALSLLKELGRLNISRKEILEDINLAQCLYAFHTKNDELMQRLYSELESDDLIVNNYQALFRNIEEATTLGIDEVIEDFRQMGQRNPFFEHGVLEAARFFDKQVKDKDTAYNILLNAVNLNPFSIEYNKAYAFQCLKTGLNSYALDAREELRTMMPSVMFKTFEREFNALKADIESKSFDW